MNALRLGAAFMFLLVQRHAFLTRWLLYRKRRKHGRRRWWVRPINRVRDAQGFYHNLIRQLMIQDHEEFFGLFRMWPEQFRLLVRILRPYLIKRSIRTPLPTELRVAVTLLFLAQGSANRLTHAAFRIGMSTASMIIHETCQAIWNALHETVLQIPSKDEWKGIADSFLHLWQFPNCVGAIDGRHMRIQAPPCTGTEYHNYKQFFSMVLLATCDAQYKFTWVDVGQYGSIHDGGVWANTDFSVDLNSGVIDLPDPTPLPNENVPIPFMFVGDNAFPLTTKMMRPYPKGRLNDETRIFNYRLSRARRTIENAFGILTSRWTILHQPLRMSPENCENVFKALVCLHNFIMIGEEGHNARRYAPPGLIDMEENDGSIREGAWRENLSPHFRALGRLGGNYSNSVAYGVRDYLCEYFVSDDGAAQVPWQFDLVFQGHNVNPPL